MKQQINEVKRMQQLAGIINESQLNEARKPDLIIPANDSDDVDGEAEYFESVLSDNNITAKCKAGIADEGAVVEIYLTDKLDLKKAKKAIENDGYEVRFND